MLCACLTMRRRRASTGDPRRAASHRVPAAQRASRSLPLPTDNRAKLALRAAR